MVRYGLRGLPQNQKVYKWRGDNHRRTRGEILELYTESCSIIVRRGRLLWTGERIINGKRESGVIGRHGKKAETAGVHRFVSSQRDNCQEGHGKVRHIDVCQLWVQQEVHRNKITIVKVKGDNTIADILTKHVKRETLQRHVNHMKMERRKDRHEMNPTMAQDE